MTYIPKYFSSSAEGTHLFNLFLPNTMLGSDPSMNFLITGAARGIGRGLTRLLLQKGHRVIALDNNVPELSHTESLFSAYRSSSSFFSLHCDLRDPTAIQDAAATTADVFSSHLDVLINNAADTSTVLGPTIEDLTLQQWNDTLATNLTAPMLLSQACLPLLRKSPSRPRAGCIVNISSTRAHQSEPHSEGYAASKAGLLGLTHALASSLAELGTGVRVNAVVLGWVSVADECEASDREGKGWEEAGQLKEEDHEWHWAGRVGMVEDVREAVEYLRRAEWVTGSEVVVDGGVGRKMVYPE
ncbi:NAD(P)-binding protein [Viridothelium virens]|uniref:NAD(P)-binding protein n=1 Tax=Viridothelium virens TaxID=1048519 RepID=A0A6A6GYL5_VIRVR|nr:NAD(P)-binding protein [Viridothelium virens]